MRGEVDRAFALVRPPGHHAMAMVHGIRGFCTINIVSRYDSPHTSNLMESNALP